MISFKDAWAITRQSVSDFLSLNIFQLSAALAFFTIFSLPGLLIIIIWISDIFFGIEIVEGSVFHQIQGFVGTAAAREIQDAIHHATAGSGSPLATITGLIALLFGATSVFNEIQDSINHIWRLKAKRGRGFGILKLVFNRLLSFSMIITLGFILLVSLLINGGMDYLLNNLTLHYPRLSVFIVYILNIILTFFITSFIFAAIFKVLPDARVKWRHVWVGSFVTAFLFMLGRFIISYYLGHSRMSSAYGTAGSVIVILLWVYYSSMILYFGAAFTHAYAINRGSRIYPSNYAVWVQQIEVESKKADPQQPEENIVIEAPLPDMPGS